MYCKKRKILVAVVMVLALSFTAGGAVLANSASYNKTLPAGGGHVTLCQTTKGNSTSTKPRLSNACTSFTNAGTTWTWNFWADASGKGQVTKSIAIADVGSRLLSYTKTVDKDTSVSGRGSTSGLLTASMNVKGTVNFDVS